MVSQTPLKFEKKNKDKNTKPHGMNLFPTGKITIRRNKVFRQFNSIRRSISSLTGVDQPRDQLSKPEHSTKHCNFFKVAFSTFWLKFGATPRRQAEQSDSEARHKASNLT